MRHLPRLPVRLALVGQTWHPCPSGASGKHASAMILLRPSYAKDKACDQSGRFPKLSVIREATNQVPGHFVYAAQGCVTRVTDSLFLVSENRAQARLAN